MAMEDWCISCNRPGVSCVCNLPIKVSRLMLTVIYADGSSVMMDVKSPKECDIVLDSVDETAITGSNYEVITQANTLDLVVKTKISEEEPVIISYYPTKSRGGGV